MIQFYAPDIASTLLLPEDEAKHAIRVLRHKAGDLLHVVDGCGHRYVCRLLADHPRHATVEIVEMYDLPVAWPTDIIIAVAPTKNIDRMEWLVEKLVEIGVNRIVPIMCRHSERRELKPERLQRIAISAMKQSLKAVLPQVDSLTPFEQVVKNVRATGKFIAYCSDSVERRLFARTYKPGCDSAVVLIGPEGDFDPEEVDMAIASGYVPVTLGDNRLRTETAAIVACDTIHVINQSIDYDR